MNIVLSNCFYTSTALEPLYGSSKDLYIAAFNINELAGFHREVVAFNSNENKVILLLSESIMHIALFVIYTLGWAVSVRSIDDPSFEIFRNENRIKEFVLSDDNRVFLNELLRDARPEQIRKRMRGGIKGNIPQKNQNPSKNEH
ncbi:hypothetical protein HWQ18_07150 [Enterobacter ludwigii]|uniref:hypothetical protein n=1 Tax=Enterobacter ludwigii TaxID=299767 RepID=UPI00159C8166|nr:hypothetical protein [Enterobacter ludwigii]QLA06296.1 hypothetical protein HWQ18_07150 [Enterobacter ludwigii]